MGERKGFAVFLSAAAGGRTDIFDDEKTLAGPDHAEVAAGNVLDRVRIFAQAAASSRRRAFSARDCASDCSRLRYSCLAWSIASRPLSPTRASITSTHPIKTSTDWTARRRRLRGVPAGDSVVEEAFFPAFAQRRDKIARFDLEYKCVT